MSDTDEIQNYQHNENHEYSHIKTNILPDIVIHMDTKRDRKLENSSDKLTKYKNKEILEPTSEIRNKVEENISSNKVKLDTFEVINETSEKCINNESKDKPIIMTMYDTHYQQQESHHGPMFQQESRQRARYQDQQWGGGGYSDNAPLSYDPSTRNTFVKCVLIIVLIMLLLTAAFIAFVLATEDVKEFFQIHGSTVMIPAMILLMSAHYAMYCSPCARVPPCNFVCLIITIIAMSVLAAKVSAHYRTEVVFYAVIATAAVVFVCILLACSKFDFTSWMLYVVVIATAFSVIAMIVLATMLITGTMMKPLVIVILIVGTIIEVVILTIELQMILGGGAIELSEDDYALGAYMLYTSIMSLFMKFIQLIGFADD